MSIEDASTIDFIQVSKEKSNVNLVVTDHLEWPDDPENGVEHQYMLQEKLNAYLAYAESGQLLRDYPEVSDMQTTIQVYGKYDRPKYAVAFYDAIRPVINGAGLNFEFVLKA